jgi:hypothetical protein
MARFSLRIMGLRPSFLRRPRGAGQRASDIRCPIITHCCCRNSRSRFPRKKRKLFTLRIVATAEQIYVDPSALSRLYIHQAGSLEMGAWRHRTPGPLAVTHHGRIELVGSIALAAFRGMTTLEVAQTRWTRLDADFASNRLRQADILWRSTLNRATDLNREYGPKLGTRTLDVIHVSCALELKLPWFLTFDQRQQKLAEAVGLKLIAVV